MAAVMALGCGLAGCGVSVADGRSSTGDEPAAVESALAAAEARSVTVDGSVCGAAGPSGGSGVALDGGRVLTAAHVVASADELVVGRQGRTHPARLIAIDPLRDLALLEPTEPLDEVPDSPVTARAAAGDVLSIVAARSSGTVDAVVQEVTRIEIDEVRGTRRSVRDGLVLDAVTRTGDSGAGVYDDGGRLVGLLFAVSTEDAGRSWATAASEIDAFLAEPEHRGRFRCDPAGSKVTRVDG